MNKLCLILWMIFTLILTFSIVGLLLFIPSFSGGDERSDTPSTWMTMGKTLLKSVIEK